MASVPLPTPSQPDISYGDHPRQRFDLWLAKAAIPTPLVVIIHGFGGDKRSLPSTLPATFVQRFLDAGISVASINYRSAAEAAGLRIDPPVKAGRIDAARALQTLRARAKEWNLDPARVAATGWSAGGATALWLALHEEMADLESLDPIERQSTRLVAVAVNRAQAVFDPKLLREWAPNYTSGPQWFGFGSFQAFYDARERVLPSIREFSPVNHVSSDDPPVFLEYPMQQDSAFLGQEKKDSVHNAMHGLYLADELRKLGVESTVVYSTQPYLATGGMADFLISRLANQGRR